MSKSAWKTAKNFDKRFEERERLITPFVKLLGGPVIVHSVKETRKFNTILVQGKLKIPSKHNSPVKCPYMAGFLKIHDVVYYSLGFVYATAYDFSYSFIFDDKFVKELKYYTNAVSGACYRAVVNYWYDNDRDYLERLAGQSPECRAVVDKYYAGPPGGKPRSQFDFWRIEETLFDFVMNYAHKEKLLQIIRAKEKDLLLKYPKSLKHARAHYATQVVPELISQHSVDLLKNPHFKGVYINGKIPKSTRTILEKKYAGKLIFDGKKITTINQK